MKFILCAFTAAMLFANGLSQMSDYEKYRLRKDSAESKSSRKTTDTTDKKTEPLITNTYVTNNYYGNPSYSSRLVIVLQPWTYSYQPWPYYGYYGYGYWTYRTYSYQPWPYHTHYHSHSYSRNQPSAYRPAKPNNLKASAPTPNHAAQHRISAYAPTYTQSPTSPRPTYNQQYNPYKSSQPSARRPSANAPAGNAGRRR